MEAPVPPQPAPEPQPAAAGPPDRLWNQSFFLLWLGQTISQLGNPAFNIGAMLWMKDTTGSASLMGLLMTATALPALLLGPFGGTFADRHSRVRIMVWSDVAAGIAVLVFTAAIWLRPADPELIIPLLFVVAVALGIIRAVFHPAVSAFVPDIVSKEKLPAATSLTQLSVQASIFSGQALGGVLYKAFGPALLFCIDGVSYLIAAVCTLFIPRDRPRQRPAPAEARSFRYFLSETADGFRYVWSQKGLRDVLLTAALINFLSAPGLVLFPFYVDLYLNAEASWYGYLMAGLSVGVVVGFVGAGALRLTGQARVQGILANFILYPFFFGSLVFLRAPIPALVAVFLGGMTTGFVNVYLIALAQGSTPAELRGRVMAFMGLLTGGLMPLGMALGGLAGDLTNKNVPLIFGVCAVLALLNVLLLAFRRHAREYLAS